VVATELLRGAEAEFGEEAIVVMRERAQFAVLESVDLTGPVVRRVDHGEASVLALLQ